MQGGERAAGLKKWPKKDYNAAMPDLSPDLSPDPSPETPTRVTLVSGSQLDFLTAAETTDDLLHYEVYSHWRCSCNERAIAQKLLDQRSVYFLDANVPALLLERAFGYARVKLLQSAGGKPAGWVCWVHSSSIASLG